MKLALLANRKYAGGRRSVADTWRLLRSPAATGAWNMAIDEALLDLAVPGAAPVLRLYAWRPAALSLGYFQDAAVVDRAACQQAGVDVVRRPTGGRAVLHDDEVTYAIVLPPSHPLANIGVVESYRMLSEGLVRGLLQLQVQAEMARLERESTAREAQGAVDPTTTGMALNLGAQAACFDAPSWYELVVAGRKLVGSAQVRRKGALLQHGSVPLGLEAAKLYGLLHFRSEQTRARAVKAFAAKAMGLRDIVAQVTYDQVAAALIGGISAAMGCTMHSDSLTATEQARALELLGRHADEHYVLHRGKK